MEPTAPGAQGGEAPPSAPTQPSSPSASEGAAPSPEGTAASEEEIAARALERALVQRGVLLLAPGEVEVAPELAYAHDGFDAPVATDDGVALGRVRRHVAASSLGVRVGIPGKLQLDAVLPFIAARQRITAGTGEQRASVDPGVGDVRLSLTSHLLSRSGGAFQLLAGATWRAPTGKSPFRTDDELGRGSGVHAIAANATIVRISDPLVLLATAGYTTSFSRRTPIGRVDLADAVKLSLSSLLAVTPRESISFQVEVEHGGDLRRDRARVVGTDRTVGTAQLGVSMVLSRRVLLSVTAAMGITEDAPDFQLGASLPVRF